MNQNTDISRTQLLPPGLAIVIAVLGLIGAVSLVPWYVSYVCAGFSAVATVIFIAQSIDKLLSGEKSVNDSAPLTFPRSTIRLRFSLTTLLLIEIVVSIFFGLSICSRVYYECNCATDGYLYGCPFRCIDVPNNGRATLDFLWLAADVTAGIALVVGIDMEVERFRRRRG
jgi:hypothetical protein